MTEIIIGAVVVVFALWDAFAYSKWIVVIAGAALLLHAFMCGCKGMCDKMAAGGKDGKQVAKKKK